MIFTPDRISKGYNGGRNAAESLSMAIKDFIKANYHTDAPNMWLWMFFKSRGLVKALTDAGYAISHYMIEQFVLGFNSAHSQFSAIGVGGEKEGVDYKIKGTSSYFFP